MDPKGTLIHAQKQSDTSSDDERGQEDVIYDKLLEELKVVAISQEGFFLENYAHILGCCPVDDQARGAQKLKGDYFANSHIVLNSRAVNAVVWWNIAYPFAAFVPPLG